MPRLYMVACSAELGVEGMRKIITQTLITLLMVDAAIVAIILISGWTAWPWICAYWVILTLKNAVDWIPARETHSDRIKRLEAQDGE